MDAFDKLLTAVGRLKLNKVWYCSSRYDSDKYSDGTLKIQQGWVVTGLMDSNKSFYYIPVNYAGLPIIGILHTAYEQMTEYKDDDKYHKTGDDKIDLPVRINFRYDKMLFVFAPRRYTDRYHVLPTYIVNTTKDNAADMYGAAYFSYARNGVDNLLTQIMRIKNVPYNFGYTSMGKCSDYFSYYERGSYGKDVKRTDEVAITLRQSSAGTFDTCYKPRKDDKLLEYIPDKYTDLWRTSWKALRVGKYYSLGKFARRANEIRDYCDAHNAVVGFIWQPVGKDIACAFNLIGGTEVIVRPSLLD